MIFQNLGLCDFLIGCADAYRTAEAQQAAQPRSGPARQLACNMMVQFFAQPIPRAREAQILWSVASQGFLRRDSSGGPARAGSGPAPVARASV